MLGSLRKMLARLSGNNCPPRLSVSPRRTRLELLPLEDRTVPAGFSFSVHVHNGTGTFTTPAGQVDPAAAFQSLPVPDLELTLDSETFYGSEFTDTPTAEYEYGVLQGVTFTLAEIPNPAFAFEALRAAGGDVIWVEPSADLESAYVFGQSYDPLTGLGDFTFQVGTEYGSGSFALDPGEVDPMAPWQWVPLTDLYFPLAGREFVLDGSLDAMAYFENGQFVLAESWWEVDPGNTPPHYPYTNLSITTGGYFAGVYAELIAIDQTPLSLDPDAVVTVSKVSDAAEAGSDGVFRFARTGDTSAALTVDFTVGGTATSGTDFISLGTSVTFPIGESTVDVTVDVTDDGTAEPTETVTVAIDAGAGYVAGTAGSADVTIADNETPVVSVGDGDTSEGTATGGFTFTRIGDLTGSLSVNYSVGGTATSKTDYEALAGTVAFAAGDDRAEVRVEAFGDNTADDNETVVATVTSGTGYTIDGDADEATVTIADQPLTVSVIRLSDGEEGVGNAVFRFTRSGDISGSLTVGYTVGGTATPGTDYTTLSGSVTFAATVDYTDVTVTVTNDGSGEQTETVTVTLDEDDDYLLGIDSDSVFIRDNDTTRVTWTGADLVNPNDWNDPDNWSTLSVPVAGDDVYFNGSVSNVSCTNAGSGLSTLYGLHIVGAYSGTVTLANALSVGTYEQTAGTLDQPYATTDLTVTAALLWSGGTLNATDSGADMSLSGSGAVGVIDPPNTGSMGTSSTLKILAGAVATFLPGTLQIVAGSGFYIDGKLKLYTEKNATVSVAPPAEGEARIEIAADGCMAVGRTDNDYSGFCTIYLPIVNRGNLYIDLGIQLEVFGVTDLLSPFSIKQLSGLMHIGSGSNIIPHYGIGITGGNLQLAIHEVNKRVEIAGGLVFAGNAISFTGHTEGFFLVRGKADWVSGMYKPRVDCERMNKCDTWSANVGFRVRSDARLSPVIVNEGIADPTNWWTILTGDFPPFPQPPAGLPNNWTVDLAGVGLSFRWRMRLK